MAKKIPKKKNNQILYFIDDDPKGYTLTEVCEHFGLKYSSVWQRMKDGMNIEDAVKDCLNHPRTWGIQYECKRKRKE